MPVLWVTIVVLLQFLNISMLSCKGKVDVGILTPCALLSRGYSVPLPAVTTDRSVYNDVILLLLMKSSFFSFVIKISQSCSACNNRPATS